MQFGKVKFIKPAHPLLAKWIKGYYLHKSDDMDFQTKLTFYQNVTTTISIYHDSETTSRDHLRIQKYKEKTGYKSLLVGLVDGYQEVEFIGPLDRIAIVFYSGGINHFIPVPLSSILQQHFSFFRTYDEEFGDFLPKVFRSTEIEKKRELLDDFFLERFSFLKEPELYHAIEILHEEAGSTKVSHLSERVGVSRRTLLRKFKRHLAYSVEQYISVLKFRRALLAYQEHGSGEGISRIALESNYYDQPDLNNAMKHRSGLTPKQLFKELSIVDNTLFWKKS